MYLILDPSLLSADAGLYLYSFPARGFVVHAYPVSVISCLVSRFVGGGEVSFAAVGFLSSLAQAQGSLPAGSRVLESASKPPATLDIFLSCVHSHHLTTNGSESTVDS